MNVLMFLFRLIACSALVMLSICMVGVVVTLILVVSNLSIIVLSVIERSVIVSFLGSVLLSLWVFLLASEKCLRKTRGWVGCLRVGSEATERLWCLLVEEVTEAAFC